MRQVWSIFSGPKSFFKGSDSFAKARADFRKSFPAKNDKADSQNNHEFRGTESKHTVSPS
jgi:hypothetical protein